MVRIWWLEKVAFATHCNLRPPDVAPVAFITTYEAYSKFEVRQPIRSSVITFHCWYFTLHCERELWPFDLERLWCIGCDVPIFAKSNSRLSYSNLNIKIWGRPHLRFRVRWISTVALPLWTPNAPKYIPNFNKIRQSVTELFMNHDE